MVSMPISRQAIAKPSSSMSSTGINAGFNMQVNLELEVWPTTWSFIEPTLITPPNLALESFTWPRVGLWLATNKWAVVFVLLDSDIHIFSMPGKSTPTSPYCLTPPSKKRLTLSDLHWMVLQYSSRNDFISRWFSSSILCNSRFFLTLSLSPVSSVFVFRFVSAKN